MGALFPSVVNDRRVPAVKVLPAFSCLRNRTAVVVAIVVWCPAGTRKRAVEAVATKTPAPPTDSHLDRRAVWDLRQSSQQPTRPVVIFPAERMWDIDGRDTPAKFSNGAGAATSLR